MVFEVTGLFILIEIILVVLGLWKFFDLMMWWYEYD
jgi:hypothetical protein